MHAFVWIGHTLEAAMLLAWVVVMFGAFGVVRWWLRRPVSSQREREAMFLAHQVALWSAITGKPLLRDAA